MSARSLLSPLDRGLGGLALGSLLLISGCNNDPIRFEIGSSPSVAIDERYLSFSVDISNITSKKIDFSSVKLETLASELPTSLLRIGGTDADGLYYQLEGDCPTQLSDELIEQGFGVCIDTATYSSICEFATRLGFSMMFTINAGPGPRAPNGEWLPEQAIPLIAYSDSIGCPVEVWEFGNEVNTYSTSMNKFKKDFDLSTDEYVRDYDVFVAALEVHYEQNAAPEDARARVAGPASAFWPPKAYGELEKHMSRALLAKSGAKPDIVTWHYYPQLSPHCPTGAHLIDEARVFHEYELLMPQSWLETVDTFGDRLVDARRENGADEVELWLGETGHALCGGVADVSNRFTSSFWWLDQLGRAPHHGQVLMVRQALIGGHYGMINLDEEEHEGEKTYAVGRPAPDFYAGVLWKQFMGPGVYDVDRIEGSGKVHVYAHSTPDGQDIGLLIINYAKEHPHTVELSDATTQTIALVTANSLKASSVMVNGELWEVDDEGNLPDPNLIERRGDLELPPTSYAFVRMPQPEE